MGKFKDKIDPVLLKELVDTCGGSCCLDPGNCECFGVMSKEVIDDLGMDTTPEEAEEEAFYDKESCAYYDKVSFETGNYIDEIRKFITGFMGDNFTEEEVERYVDLCCGPGGSVEKYSGMLVMEKVFRETTKGNSTKKKEYVYLLHTEHSVKIGASNNPTQRTSTLGTQIAFEILETDIFEVEDQFKTEAYLHGKFKDVRVNGEWFKLTKDHVEEIFREFGSTYVPNRNKSR